MAKKHPPILPEHRTAPDWTSMTYAEQAEHRRRVWAHYIPGWGAPENGGINPELDEDRADYDEVLEVLRINTSPVYRSRWTGDTDRAAEREAAKVDPKLDPDAPG